MATSPNTIKFPWNNVEIRYKKGSFLTDNVESAAKEALEKHSNPFNVPQDTFVALTRSTHSSVLAGIQEPNKKGQLLEEAAEPSTGSYPAAVKRILNRVAQELAKK